MPTRCLHHIEATEFPEVCGRNRNRDQKGITHEEKVGFVITVLEDPEDSPEVTIQGEFGSYIISPNVDDTSDRLEVFFESEGGLDKVGWLAVVITEDPRFLLPQDCGMMGLRAVSALPYLTDMSYHWGVRVSILTPTDPTLFESPDFRQAYSEAIVWIIESHEYYLQEEYRNLKDGLLNETS